jgi:hypothetical protein
MSESTLSDAEGTQRLAVNAGRAVLGVVAVLIAFLVVRVEFRRREPRAVKVKGNSGGQASVTADSVSRRLVWHIDQLADVIRVTPEVKARGSVVDVKLLLETRPEIDVPMKTDEVIAVAREVVEERMGLQLGKIEVRVKHVAYDDPY